MTRAPLPSPALRRGGVPLLAAVLAAGLASCSSLAGLTGGSSASAPAPSTVAAAGTLTFDPETCPTVEIAPDGAALRSYAGGRTGVGDALQRQIALGDLARECILEGASVRIRIGTRGRVLLGPQGAPGTVPVAVRFEARRVDKVFASKIERTSVTIPSGGDGVPFAVVGELVVPVGVVTEELELAVGLDTGGAPRPLARRTRR